MRRRNFLTLPAATLGGSLWYTLAREPRIAQAAQGELKIELRFFSEKQASLVSAAAARIFPSDESGPGATEAGVVLYIDRQLAGPYGRDRYRYTSGPFREAPREFGYQGSRTPRAIYSEGLRLIAGLDTLTHEEQDLRLKQIENSLFFSLLRQHTIEGMFCDPMHGGNLGMIGWQLIGFPGPRMSYLREVDQFPGKPFRPKPVSLEQVTGKRVRPSEDLD